MDRLTSSVSVMHAMFRGATAFNQPLEGWNVGKVINMSFMFNGANAFMGNGANYISTPNNDGISKWKPALLTTIQTQGMFMGINGGDSIWKSLTTGNPLVDLNSGTANPAGVAQPHGNNPSNGMFYK